MGVVDAIEKERWIELLAEFGSWIEPGTPVGCVIMGCGFEKCVFVHFVPIVTVYLGFCHAHNAVC